MLLLAKGAFVCCDLFVFVMGRGEHKKDEKDRERSLRRKLAQEACAGFHSITNHDTNENRHQSKETSAADIGPVRLV